MGIAAVDGGARRAPHAAATRVPAGWRTAAGTLAAEGALLALIAAAGWSGDGRVAVGPLLVGVAVAAVVDAPILARRALVPALLTLAVTAGALDLVGVDRLVAAGLDLPAARAAVTVGVVGRAVLLHRIARHRGAGVLVGAWVPAVVLSAALATEVPYPFGLVLAVAAANQVVIYSPAWASGLWFRHRQRQAESRAAREAARLARVVDDERSRVAGELQGVVLASLAHMAATARTARERLDVAPEAGREALVELQTTGRDTLAAMRRLLGMLRTDGEVDGTSPLPGVGGLGDLVAAARARGVRARLEVTGDARGLAGGVDVAAYRVVEEALRGRAPGDAVAVALAHDPPDLRVTIAAEGLRPGLALREWSRLLRADVRAGAGEVTVRFPAASR
jgi:signal transduction histidine kinase